MFVCRLLLLVMSTRGLLAVEKLSPLASENPDPLATENTGPRTTENPVPFPSENPGPLTKAIPCHPFCKCMYLKSDDNGSTGDHYIEVSCHSRFVNGSFVNGSEYELTSVPAGLSPQTRKLLLLRNALTVLPAEAFIAVGLVNLKSLILAYNKIGTVHKDAFKRLEQLRVLYLDFNQINSLHADTFRGNVLLETVVLSNNPIMRLEDGLFANMSQLRVVDVQYCNLSYIGPKTFDNVPKLYHLVLSGNNLVHVSLSGLMQQRRLFLYLEKNPWKCDCQLKSLRDQMNLVQDSPSCAEPPLLANKTWLDIKSEDFVC